MLANAAGPIFTIYCLAVALPKFELVGTSAWFFFIINAFKVPFSVALGLIHGQTLALECDPEPRDPCRHVHRPLADRAHSAAALRRVAARLCRRRGVAAGGTVVMGRRPVRLSRTLALVAVALCLFPFALSLPAQPQLTWAGDPEGGAPFVEADPADPNKLTGFDVEIAELIARGLKRTPHFLFVPYGSIDQAIERGTAEIGLSGMEDTSARRAAMATTIPYYAFQRGPGCP